MRCWSAEVSLTTLQQEVPLVGVPVVREVDGEWIWSSDCSRHLTIYPFNRNNDPVSKLRIPPNRALHFMDAIRAFQVVRRQDKHLHFSVVLDLIHLPDHRFSCFKPFAIDVNICPAGPEAWNETLPNPIALIMAVAYED
jgi:hypothetical protein